MLALYKPIILSLVFMLLYSISVSASELESKKAEYNERLNQVLQEKENPMDNKELIELTRKENELAAYVRAYEKALEIIQEAPKAVFIEKNNNFSFSLDYDNADLKYLELYKAAATHYKLDWSLLAAVHDQETNFSKHPTMISSAGALGHMQFMPGTWQAYGVDGNGNGKRDPFEIEDAIFSAANYLATTGAAEGDIKGALWAYNHSTEYGLEVMAKQKYYKNNYQEEIE